MADSNGVEQVQTTNGSGDATQTKPIKSESPVAMETGEEVVKPQVKSDATADADGDKPQVKSEFIADADGEKTQEKSESIADADGDKPQVKSDATADADGDKPQVKSESIADADGDKPQEKSESIADADGDKPQEKSESIADADGDKPQEKSESIADADGDKPQVKSESTGEPSELEKKIIQQIEYYFGDVNLPRDRFLQQEIKDDDSGWVPLQTMIKFKRLAQLSEDLGVLAAATRKSTSGLMEVSEDGLKIRRSPDRTLPEMSDSVKDDWRRRSIYAKGFPEDATLDDLMEFFEKVGKTDQVSMRKNREKDFKGSCFVLYHTDSAAQEFLTSELTAKYGESELKRLMKEDYFKMKTEERKKHKDEESKKKQEQREEFMKKQRAEDKKHDVNITHGAVLHLKNLPEDVTREDVKALFSNHGTVAWVEFDRGDPTANLRFKDENGAPTALASIKAANEEKVMMSGQELECSVLEGEAELSYWKDMFSRKKHTGHSSGGRGGRHSKSNQFYGKNRKRKSGGREDGPREKLAKTDD